jgi:hypothetical protein
MRYMCLLVCALLMCAGCASDSNKGAWDEFWKDLRGDNMKMRSDFSAVK